MIIQNIMEAIWKPISEQYWNEYDSAMNLSAVEIYQGFVGEKMKYFPYVGVNMNYVNTLGCPYRMKNKRLAGCSMCDYQSEFAAKQGALLALREKDPELYAKCVRENFLNSRVESDSSVIENISGYDSLDYSEVPEELCIQLFSKELFTTSPFIYNIEARASSITRERLTNFSKTVSGKKRVSIDFGVEVADEWIRNHWLNKEITNTQIENAVELLHEFHFKAVGNVLLGLPGLTEEQSIEEFVKTVLWMDDIGIDKIVVHVLNRKKYTIHGFIHDSLSDNKVLQETGLVNGEHTGLPWLFTVLRAINNLYRAHKNIFSKTVIVRIDPAYNSITNKVCYNADEQCKCNKEIMEFINNLVFKKNYFEIQDFLLGLKADDCYIEYEKLLNKQKSQAGIHQTIEILCKEITKKLLGKECKVDCI